MLTLWGGGHIGSSRMEQSYCTSGFFRQRVTARNHSNYQPTPRRRSIIAYGKRENARSDKCVAVCVICFIFFLAAPFYASRVSMVRHSYFPVSPPPLRYKCCDWHVWFLNVYPEHRKLFWLFYMEFACIKSMCWTLFILFMIGLHWFSFQKSHNFEVHFSSNFILSNLG